MSTIKLIPPRKGLVPASRVQRVVGRSIAELFGNNLVACEMHEVNNDCTIIMSGNGYTATLSVQNIAEKGGVA